MKKGLCAFVVVIMAVCLLPTITSATPIAVGDPWLTESWAQRFEEAGVGNFNKMEIFTLTGNSFEPEGFRNFSSAGWSSTLLNPGYALATGTALNYMQFDIFFLGNPAPLSFDFLAYNEIGTIVDHTRATYQNGGWTFAATSDPIGGYDRTPVPEPATMLLLGLGLAGLAGIKRKFNS